MVKAVEFLDKAKVIAEEIGVEILNKSIIKDRKKITKQLAMLKKFQKKQEHIKRKNEDIEKRKLLHFESLGKKMNEIRVKDKKINTFYTQIDKIDEIIKELKAEIQSLSK